MKEICADIGRCHRFCRNGSLCGFPGVCGMPVVLANGSNSGQRACNLGPSQCKPFEQTGCPHPALNCYATGLSESLCDCPNGKNLPQGADCTDYNDCAVGLRCLQLMQNGPTQCLRVCNTTADCPGCVPLGSTGGYCP